ncbi:MAG: hypothetical protein RI897_2703 [Verrucomicrobiota bacterium]
MKTIYFDANATTALDSGVYGVMQPFFERHYGNPSSVHRVGREVRALLDDARERAAGVLGCKPSELIFTSGGSESNNLALQGALRLRRGEGRHVLVSPTEHPAVLGTLDFLARHDGVEVTRLAVDRWGRVDPADVERGIRGDTVLVSVMSANNETGGRQPVAEIGGVCRERGVLFHTDAVQSFGKEVVGGVGDFVADLVTVCGHKFHGPKGVGALYARSPLILPALIQGGPQENERRAGTENVAGIMGFVAALERFVRMPVFPVERLGGLTRRLEEAVLGGVEGVCGVSPGDRLANTVGFVVEGCDSMALLAALDLAGVCASSGSACSAGSVEPSHVLLAQGYSREEASSFVRFSLDRDSTVEEVEYVAGLFPGLVRRIRGAG